MVVVVVESGGWEGCVVCFETLISAAQTYNYERSEVKKLLRMNRQSQQGGRL